MSKQTVALTARQHIPVFNVKQGKCIVCWSKGPVIPHVGRLGNKEYMLCESCTHNMWERSKIQA